MRVACACAVVCALVAVVCGADSPTLDTLQTLEAERHLLRLLGLPRRPPRRAHPPSVPVVPPAMRTLYAQQGSYPAPAANTVRSFHHSPSRLDDRFPAEHRFRLYFNLTAVPSDEQPRGADLTLQRAHGSTGRQQLLLYDVVRPGRKGVSDPILRLIDSVPLRPTDEVVRADAAPAARRWLADPRHNHGLLVRVLDEEVGGDARKTHVRVRRRAEDTDEEWHNAQPLLLLYTEDERAREARERGDAVSRMKRAAAQRRNRNHHRRKEAREICQRRPLFVDFADVGWSDWIVAPHGYDAYYCQGDCPFPLADHLNGTNHAIVQTLVNSVNPAAVPKACCVPTQLSSISMLYMDEGNNVVLKNYQDMMVVGCGCR